MCQCNPEIRTPFCGKLNCEWPKPENIRTLRIADPAPPEPIPFVPGAPAALTEAEVHRIMMVKENAPPHIADAMQRLFDGIQIFMVGNDQLTRQVQELAKSRAEVIHEFKRMQMLSVAQTEAVNIAIARRDYHSELASRLPRWKRALFFFDREKLNFALQSAGTVLYRAVIERAQPGINSGKEELHHGKS